MKRMYSGLRLKSIAAFMRAANKYVFQILFCVWYIFHLNKSTPIFLELRASSSKCVLSTELGMRALKPGPDWSGVSSSSVAAVEHLYCGNFRCLFWHHWYGELSLPAVRLSKQIHLLTTGCFKVDVWYYLLSSSGHPFLDRGTKGNV